ncbi:MAG: hypothetical protein RH862_20220 [Leptospiraceae bacterium]
MPVRSDGLLRGHPIYWDGEQYRYLDNDALTTNEWQSRPCGFCGLNRTAEGFDGCIGHIPGAINACCGHGQVACAYIQYAGGSEVRGKDAIPEIELYRSGAKNIASRDIAR